MDLCLIVFLSLITVQIVTGSTESVDFDGYCESPDGCETRLNIYNEGK